nr:hypothetical protein GCM10020093_099410 [Planobispora longispora]
MRRPRLLYVPFWMTYVFLYAPIAVLVVMSFNSGDSPYSFDGFSLKWYGELAGNAEIGKGLVNTLLVAAGSTVLATALGTLLAVGLARYSRSKVLDAIGVLPAVLPDLVLAIGLLVFYGTVKMTLGLHSVLLAHTVFGMAFVAAVVRTRLTHADFSLEEASRDLGAPRRRRSSGSPCRSSCRASPRARCWRSRSPSTSSSSRSSPRRRPSRPCPSSSTQWSASGSPRRSTRWPRCCWP